MMEITDIKLLGVTTSYGRGDNRWADPKREKATIATLAEIKKFVQPLLSKWAASFDLAVMRRKFDNGELGTSWTCRPKRGAKNWVSLRSDKKTHTFEIGIQNPDEENEYTIATRKYAKHLEQLIEEKFDQKVPVNIGRIPTYTSGTVTSGESSSTVFRGEELGDDDWF
jgi:hypothetical protein